MDVGAKDIGLPMDSVEIYQEGFRWNPVKVHEKGKPKLEKRLDANLELIDSFVLKQNDYIQFYFLY